MSSSEQFNFRQSKSYEYHVKTKHSLASLYSSPGGLDWAQQPNPFRVYEGSQKIVLPRDFAASELGLFTSIKNMNLNFLAQSLSSDSLALELDGLKFVSALLYFSMSLSAWKQVKGGIDKWALRVNPSSGNLHPTETHILTQGLNGIEDGAYHYSVRDHSLEIRAKGDLLYQVKKLLAIDEIENAPLVLCLNSIFWREAWKYRDRAYRYCQLDMGHAAAAVSLSATTLSSRVFIVGEFPDSTLAEKLAFVESDEKPMLLLAIFPKVQERGVSQNSLGKSEMAALPHSHAASFDGSPNRLSQKQIDYQSIEGVYEAGCLTYANYLKRNVAQSHADSRLNLSFPQRSIDLSECYLESKIDPPAHAVMRKRRSAVDMDGKLRISLARLATILIGSSRGYSSTYTAPLPIVATDEQGLQFIHIIVYVHRVDGVEPGVYYFDRSKLLLQCMNESNIRSFAKFVSCLQDIAADGVFALSLVADFQASFRCFGERAYRYIHQEAGFIGQLLYLTARALSIDATGIGCFLDDEINQSLPDGMEVVYNFTFGRAVLDQRLTDLPAYEFEDPSSLYFDRLEY